MSPLTKIADSLIALVLRKSMREPYKTISVVLSIVRKFTNSPSALGYFDFHIKLSSLEW